MSEQAHDRLVREAALTRTRDDLALLLRTLRRRHARRHRDGELTYRALAQRTGWSHTAVAEYFTGKTLPPTDRFDALIELLGVTPAEQGALATARDRVDEHRRDLAPVPAGPPGGAPDAGWVVARQLPPAARHFAGRSAELAELAGLVGQVPTPGTVLITAIIGTAGIGKTTLAVHWAHQVADEFPDGQLYLNLRGFDPSGPATEPAEAVRRFLAATGVPPARIPADLDGQTALYRSRVAGRQLLIVLDNARDSAQVRPLLPSSPTCQVLVTSRNQLTGLTVVECAHPITLNLLPKREARNLVLGRIGPDRSNAEPEAVDEIVNRCGGLPLALAIVAARAAINVHLPLTTVAEGLRTIRDRLDALAGDGPDSDLRAVFSWSYRTLTPDAARLFRLLGLHPGPDVTAPAAASLAAVSPTAVRPLLAELTRANLLDEHAPGRYAMHDLLRAYAAEQADAHERAEQCQAVTLRMVEHYLHTAHAADRLLQVTKDPLVIGPPTRGVVPEPIADTRQALAWFSAEHAVLLAAVDCSVSAGFDVVAWQLAWVICVFLDRRGHWQDLAAVQRVALGAARRSGDLAAQAFAHRGIARADTRLGRYDEAYGQLGQALDLYRQRDDHTGQGKVHMNLCLVWERRGRHGEALDHAQQALDLFRAVGSRRDQAGALNTVGWQLALLGDHEDALSCCQQALAVLEEVGDRLAQAETWDSLGYAHHGLGHQAEAVACYGRAIDLLREVGERHLEALSLTSLGDIQYRAGNGRAARDAWQEALGIIDDLRLPEADPLRVKLATAEASERCRLGGSEHTANRGNGAQTGWESSAKAEATRLAGEAPTAIS
jgi:tetratricopeptide (TPR) repeat protein